MNLIFLWTLLPLVVSANHEPSDAEKAEISSGARREAAILKYASKRFKYADFPTFPARKYLDVSDFYLRGQWTCLLSYFKPQKPMS